MLQSFKVQYRTSVSMELFTSGNHAGLVFRSSCGEIHPAPTPDSRFLRSVWIAQGASPRSVAKSSIKRPVLEGWRMAMIHLEVDFLAAASILMALSNQCIDHVSTGFSSCSREDGLGMRQNKQRHKPQSSRSSIELTCPRLLKSFLLLGFERSSLEFLITASVRSQTMSLRFAHLWHTACPDCGATSSNLTSSWPSDTNHSSSPYFSPLKKSEQNALCRYRVSREAQKTCQHRRKSALGVLLLYMTHVLC